MGNLNSQFRVLGLHLAIMADGESRGVPFSTRDQQVLTERSRSEGSSFLHVTLPSFGRAVDQGLISGVFKAPASWALKKDTRLPKFLNACLSQIFSDDGDLLGRPNVVTIFYVRQLLLINSKLVLPVARDIQLQTVRSFFERQNSLRKIVLDKSNPVLNLAIDALFITLRKLSLRDITPGHGPGVVADGKARDEKYDIVVWPRRANRTYPYFEYGVQSLEHLRQVSNRVHFLKDMITKICLVPKDYRGPRLISAEYTATQYLQQGQMRSMMDYIERSRILSKSIRLRDQTLNQDRSRTAYPDFVTLDLSNASDTVSSPLVWFLLGRLPRLRRELFSTRSHYASFEGMVGRLCAFAPMGSATCFPVETLVFWSLAIATVHLHRFGRKKVTAKTLSELGTLVTVFGDDIIVPADCYETLASVLRSVGCEPSESKTCWRTPFRESCGSEWYNGTNVTITRNKRYNYATDNKISHFPALADLQRRLYVAGLYRAADLVKGWAEAIHPTLTVGVRSILEDEPQSWQHVMFRIGLLRDTNLLGRDLHPDLADWSHVMRSVPSVFFGSYDRYDRGLEVRWNLSLQRAEFRVPVFRQKVRDWRPEGYTRLLARLLSDSSDRVAIRGSNTGIAWRPFPFRPFAPIMARGRAG